jgi:hypothetical protein
MSKKPDLGEMAMPKARAAAAVPFSAPDAAATIARPPRSLTVKLDGELYADLVTYCYEQQQGSGTRVTHQEAMVRGLKMLLGKGS